MTRMYIATNAGKEKGFFANIRIKVIYNADYEFTRETWIDCSDIDYDYYMKGIKDEREQKRNKSKRK